MIVSKKNMRLRRDTGKAFTKSTETFPSSDPFPNRSKPGTETLNPSLFLKRDAEIMEPRLCDYTRGFFSK